MSCIIKLISRDPIRCSSYDVRCFQTDLRCIVSASLLSSHHSNLIFISHFITRLIKETSAVAFALVPAKNTSSVLWFIYMTPRLAAFVVKILTNFVSLAVYDTEERAGFSGETGAEIYCVRFFKCKFLVSQPLWWWFLSRVGLWGVRRWKVRKTVIKAIIMASEAKCPAEHYGIINCKGIN